MRFTQAYSQSPVCSPTRIAYTGRYPGRSCRGSARLASAWDEFFGNFSGGVDYFSKLTVGTDLYDLYENEVQYQDLRYYTEILGERVDGFLRRPHPRPWLLNLNFTAAHWPWEGPADQAVSDELTARARAGERSASVHLDGDSLKTYGEMVGALDKAVGMVMSALRDSGQLDNTLVSSPATTAAGRSPTRGPSTTIPPPDPSPAAGPTFWRALSASRPFSAGRVRSGGSKRISPPGAAPGRQSTGPCCRTRHRVSEGPSVAEAGRRGGCPRGWTPCGVRARR